MSNEHMNRAACPPAQATLAAGRGGVAYRFAFSVANARVLWVFTKEMMHPSR